MNNTWFLLFQSQNGDGLANTPEKIQAIAAAIQEALDKP